MNRAPVMLFMKGNPDNPQCGFSRQTVALLRGEGVQFGWFDIFSDQSVREGLKKHNDWPSESKASTFGVEERNGRGGETRADRSVCGSVFLITSLPIAFPQIIVKGELIGGLDILKELIASGEFAELIQGI